MAFTLGRAVEDLEARLGPYQGSSWHLGKMRRTLYDDPMKVTPFGKNFEEKRSQPGSARTPLMNLSNQKAEHEGYAVNYGSTFKALFDMAEPTSAYFSLDVELDQTKLYGKRPVDPPGFVSLWEHGRYFRLPTREIADEIRFKLKETEESTFLYPELVESRPEKPKGGCPFGYT